MEKKLILIINDLDEIAVKSILALKCGYRIGPLV
jgi:hypothetical protein